MEEKMHISWSELDALTTKLAEKVVTADFKPDYLVGIAIGGLIPLALLSRRLNIKNVATITARAYEHGVQKTLQITTLPDLDLRGARVLLVDEIADTGTTLVEIGNILREKYGVREIKTATIAVRSDKCKTVPDFSVLVANRWIVFPWENKG